MDIRARRTIIYQELKTACCAAIWLYVTCAPSLEFGFTVAFGQMSTWNWWCGTSQSYQCGVQISQSGHDPTFRTSSYAQPLLIRIQR